MTDLAKAEPGLHLQDDVPQSGPDFQRPLPYYERAIVFADRPEILTQVVRHQSEPPLVIEGLRDPFRLEEMLERSGGLPDEEQCMLERDTQINAVLERALDLRKVPEGLERSIEEDDGFPVGRTSDRLHRGSGEVLERFVPHLAFREVVGERRGVVLHVIGVELLHGGRHPTMQRLTAVRRDLGERNFPDCVVTEIEAVADPVDHTFPHELLDAGGGLQLPQRRGTLEQRVVELATDDRGGGHDLARP